MTLKKQIVELLSKNELNANEISEILQIPKDHLWVYLKTLLDEGKIMRTTNKKPYKYKIIEKEDCKELMKELYKIMTEKTMFKEKINENELKIVEKIEQVLEIE